MDISQPQPLAYAPPADDSEARQITRLLLLTTLALSSLGLIYGAVMLTYWADDVQTLLTPIED